MKAPDFVYVRATSLDHALELKAKHGEHARWLAGGQSLLAALAFRLSEPTALIDISRLENLRGVTLLGERLRIGAGTTHTAVLGSSLIRTHTPLLSDAVPHIAHAAIRNRGTIGGSLAFADPAAELPACCVALDATLVAFGPGGERRIPASDFFEGVYATALKENELLTAIEIPIIRADEQHALVEVCRRSGDYAMAGIAVVVRRDAEKITKARLVYFALGDRPVTAGAAEKALLNHQFNEDSIDAAAAAALADLDPPGDLNGAPATKRHLAQVVLRRALTQIMTARVTS